MTALFDDMMHGLDAVEGYLAGKTKGYRVTVPDHVDVKSIRKRLQMTQAGFSAAFGFSLDAVKHWEGGRRTPESSARAFLTVISKNPAAVLGALHPPASNGKSPRLAARKTGPRVRSKAVRASRKQTNQTAKTLGRAA